MFDRRCQTSCPLLWYRNINMNITRWSVRNISNKKIYIYFDTHVKKRSPRQDLWESVLHTGPDAVTRSIWFWFLRVTWCFFYCPPKNVAQSRVRENEREIAKQASSVHWCGLLTSILIESAQSKAPGPTLAHQRFGIWPKTSMKMILWWYNDVIKQVCYHGPVYKIYIWILYGSATVCGHWKYLSFFFFFNSKLTFISTVTDNRKPSVGS